MHWTVRKLKYIKCNSTFFICMHTALFWVAVWCHPSQSCSPPPTLPWFEVTSLLKVPIEHTIGCKWNLVFIACLWWNSAYIHVLLLKFMIELWAISGQCFICIWVHKGCNPKPCYHGEIWEEAWRGMTYLGLKQLPFFFKWAFTYTEPLFLCNSHQGSMLFKCQHISPVLQLVIENLLTVHLSTKKHKK